jgi:hypothetical protein
VTEINQIDWDLLLKLREVKELTADDSARMGDGNPVLTGKHKRIYSNTDLFSFIDIGQKENVAPLVRCNYIELSGSTECFCGKDGFCEVQHDHSF